MTDKNRSREPRGDSGVGWAAFCDGAVAEPRGEREIAEPFPLPYRILRGGMYAAAPMLIPGKRIGEQSETIGSQVAVLHVADRGERRSGLSGSAAGSVRRTDSRSGRVRSASFRVGRAVNPSRRPTQRQAGVMQAGAMTGTQRQRTGR